jgi:hypothetical protein
MLFSVVLLVLGATASLSDGVLSVLPSKPPLLLTVLLLPPVVAPLLATTS